MPAKVQSVEPNIAGLANGWLKEYKLEYKLEQELLNEEIDNSLSEYYSKSGGKGGNRPDAKLLLKDSNSLLNWPILIEYKGYKDKLIKESDGTIENTKKDNSPNYTNIKGFAVNGAVHYANALLHYTAYEHIIAIGMTGYKDSQDNLKYEIGVYYVSKANFGAGQKIGEYTDFSFLKKENFDDFVTKVKSLTLSEEEREKIKNKREEEIDASLVKLNNDIYQNEKGLNEQDRVHLVAASIIASLGVAGEVSPLEKSDLKSKVASGHDSDGQILSRKIEDFLSKKNLPDDKKVLVLRSLQNTILSENINKIKDGESQLKRVFTKIVDDLGFYYKIGLTTDFTGNFSMRCILGLDSHRTN